MGRWLDHLTGAQKAMGAIIAIFLLGVTTGTSMATLSGVPRQVRRNTAAIVTADSVQKLWRTDVIVRLDHLTNAVVYHICESEHDAATTSQAFTACVIRTRQQLRDMGSSFAGNGYYPY